MAQTRVVETGTVERRSGHAETAPHGRDPAPQPQRTPSPSSPDEQPAGARSPRRIARWVLRFALVAVAVHAALIALWVAPNNLARQEIGPDRLGAYVLPMFDQTWRVFAPEADYRYDLFDIRALVEDEDGTLRETEWAEVTAREVAPAVLHHPFPSRTALMSTRLAGHVQQTFDDLSTAQQRIVAEAGQAVDLAELERRLIAAAVDDEERAAVAPYIRTETATERFLSGIAATVWGDRAVALQFRKYSLTVPNYTSGVEERQVKSAYSFHSNWRPVTAPIGQAEQVFAGYVDEYGIGR